jgi:hypothetical protein
LQTKRVFTTNYSGIQVLIDFVQTLDNLSTAHLRALEKVEQDLKRIIIASSKQVTLDEQLYGHDSGPGTMDSAGAWWAVHSATTLARRRVIP